MCCPNGEHIATIYGTVLAPLPFLILFSSPGMLHLLVIGSPSFDTGFASNSLLVQGKTMNTTNAHPARGHSYVIHVIAVVPASSVFLGKVQCACFFSLMLSFYLKDS
jgi:hypothetical protein